jgi:uncharacterized protein (TIGR03437 family)
MAFKHCGIRLCAWLALDLASGFFAIAQTTGSVVDAGHEAPTPVVVAPRQMVTFFIHGFGSDVAGPIWANSSALPTSLGGISAGYGVTGGNDFELPLSLLAVQSINPCFDATQPGCKPYLAVTAQIPYNINAQNPATMTGVPPTFGQIRFRENGSTVAALDVIPLVDATHVLRTCDLLFTSPTAQCAPVVTHSSGKLVNSSAPAKAGETITVWAVGLGALQESLPTPTGQPSPAASATVFPFTVRFDVNQAGSDTALVMLGAVSFSGSTPGSVGLYQINVAVPSFASSAPCANAVPSITGFFGMASSNTNVTIRGPSSTDSFDLCLQP